MTPPFKRLAYLYVGSREFEKDLAYYRDVLGAEVVWNFHAFGAHVAAVRLGDGPLYLLADHRAAPSVLPVYEVETLAKTVKQLKAKGWKPAGEPFEIPPGPCYLFKDPSGNELAIYENVRPEHMRDEFGETEA